MQTSSKSALSNCIRARKSQILDSWVNAQLSELQESRQLVDNVALRQLSQQFLDILELGLASGEVTRIQEPIWADARSYLAEFAQLRARQGFTPSENASLVFSLKQPLYEQMQSEYAGKTDDLSRDLWLSGTMLDRLGLFTTEIFQKSREEVIRRQQQEMMELSSPVIRIWDNILAIPVIGTLDSARTQVIMENLLNEIVNTGSSITIIDITGVPTVDTQTAQHLIKTISAARLMGAECIISGIRPAIAQTIVHLGIDIADVVTVATMASAVKYALTRCQLKIVSTASN